MKKDNNNCVVILCPMNCESDLLISSLEDMSESRESGYCFFEGKINGCQTVVVRCLMGSVNAAVCSLLAIKRYSPRCIILQGTSGAHELSLKKNDIIIADKIVALNSYVSKKRGIGDGSNPFEWDDFGIQVYSHDSGKTTFTREFVCDKKLIELAMSVPYGDGRVISGTVGSGDAWNREADLIFHYHNIKGTLCEAMEGIGTAQVCAMCGIPMIEIRIISNSELHCGEQFTKDTAVKCQKFVVDYLEKLKSIL